MTQPNRPLDAFFNQDNNPLSGNYTLLDFTRTMDAHQIVNDDGAVGLEVSYTGGTIHNIIKAGESASYDLRRRNKIFVREDSGARSGISYRLSAWMTN